MRKRRDGGTGEKKQGKKKEKTDENIGHYVVASSRPPKRRTLAPIFHQVGNCKQFYSLSSEKNHGGTTSKEGGTQMGGVTSIVLCAPHVHPIFGAYGGGVDRSSLYQNL